MPNYQEWIAKHLTAYVSSKTAIKGLLTFGIWGISFIHLYPHLLELKFPESFLPYALFVMSTFTSILVVNFLSWIFFESKDQLIKYIKKRNKRLQEQEDLAREKELINAEHEKIKIEYEYLDTKSKAILFHLYKNGNDVFEWDENPVYDLNRRGYIKCIGEGNSKERIYELGPTVREFLSDHFKGIRNKKQDEL